jgi:hypothetical protein
VRTIDRRWVAVLIVVAVAAPCGVVAVRGALSGGGTARAARGVAPFAHPGVFLGVAQLEFVRIKVASGDQPWKDAYHQMISSGYASLSWTPSPRTVVECGPRTHPDKGCSDEREDALAAYTHALAWYITRDPRHARLAIRIMDAWAMTLTAHKGRNTRLQAGWVAATWPRAAEIIRYTYGGWPPASVRAFSTLLRTVYLPVLERGSCNNGNWELVMSEAQAAVAVFLDDHHAYDRAMARFRTRVAAYLYLDADGASPRRITRCQGAGWKRLVTFWQGQKTFVGGLSQETCRDFGHVGYGLSSITHVLETGRLQGRDLYPLYRERLRRALELHTTYELGNSPPRWLCGGTVHRGLGPVTEVGYNALHTRLGIPLPHTARYTVYHRPAGTNDHFVAWETLTHANNPL